MSIELDHLILDVDDAEASSSFYADILGFGCEGEEGPFTVVRVSEGLTLQLSPRGTAGGVHLAFAMSRPEFDRVFSRVRAAGIPYGDAFDRVGTQTGPGEETGARGPGRTLYFLDPNRHLLEIRHHEREGGAARGETSAVGPLTVADFERLAHARLPRPAWDYYRSGADDEVTLARNTEAFASYEIRYRALVDVSAPRLATSVLGTPVKTPILVAPTAYHKLACPEGERATARAASRAGSLYVASTLATTTLEDVASACEAPRWFQLYVHKDRAFTTRLVERAKAAGYVAIALTCDTPVLGRRLADVRNGFGLTEGLALANLQEILPPDLRSGPGSELARFVASRHDASLSWKDLDWLVALAAPLPVVVKGIVRGDDAVRALDHGARAVWVSNHGGRQLDLAPATIDALVEVVAAVGDRAEVYVDGGVRSGTHALVALGLGARAVFVGRPVLWGLAADGEEGARSVLALLTEELDRAMRLAGCAELADTRHVVRRRG